MSLHGYKPKTKPALWTTLPQVKKLKREHDAKAVGTRHGKRFCFIRPVSKRQQKRTKQYVAAAREFVQDRRKWGCTCVVVDTIPELFNGRKYGHPISNELSEIHHRRGRLGSLLMDQRFWMAVSKEGHRWIHAHPKEARKYGWLCQPGEWNTPP